jgi:hypothetical protein
MVGLVASLNITSAKGAKLEVSIRRGSVERSNQHARLAPAHLEFHTAGSLRLAVAGHSCRQVQLVITNEWPWTEVELGDPHRRWT